MKHLLTLTLLLLSLLPALLQAQAQIHISHSKPDQIVTFGNAHLAFTLNYHNQCAITKLVVNGENVIGVADGITTEVRTIAGTISSLNPDNQPVVETGKKKVIVRNIQYSNEEATVRETWTFRITDFEIFWDTERFVPVTFTAEETAFPAIRFSSINTWEGANTGYGGLAWFYLFNEKLCTYGVHSGEAAFWNEKTGNGLRIETSAPGQEAASKFCRTENDALLWSVTLSDQERVYRYDPDTRRRRFIRKKTDVWAPLVIPAGTHTETVAFSWLNYRKESDRGKLAGLNGSQVSRLLNTIARIGVIDAKLFGGNSWHTPYGPVCLHEQYIGQMGIAINDPQYLEGYKECLNYYRDHAINPDGRVISRWAYDNSDAMAGTAKPEGFYEAQWGYLFDSNPDFVINVAELYHQTGDFSWVKGQKEACEKALEYLLKRDSDGDHLVEMMTADHSERKGSDWIDIMWASWENAFVNAELYQALLVWSGIERELGDPEKSARYSAFANSLKISFNKSTADGGFWDPENQWYVHWVDKDGSVHGNNLVVPVNFMAIAYGICDQIPRRNAILDRIESQMQEEDLFAWPICLYAYEPGEGLEYQYPFPIYENGDIFLSWGAMGVEAYAGYKPDIALKYIEKILARYAEDGLAFQRYGRLKQDGLGDDILAGNSLAIIGLYKSLYGINPLPDRLWLSPHLPAKLAGTELNYRFRGNTLKIVLNGDGYEVGGLGYEVKDKGEFGVMMTDGVLEYFKDKKGPASLTARVPEGAELSVEMLKCDTSEVSWNQRTSGRKGTINNSIGNLTAGKQYLLSIDGRKPKTFIADNKGTLRISIKCNGSNRNITVRDSK